MNLPPRFKGLSRFQTPLKAILQRLALIAGSLFLTVILIEFLTRIFFPQPITFGSHYQVELGDIGYRLIPLDSWESSPRSEFHVSYHINSLGFRGDELQPEENDTFRVVVLGDSFTFGRGSDEDQTYPYQLQTMLNDRYPNLNAETVNLGVEGYNVTQSRALFMKYGLQLNPELVIFTIIPNDVIAAASGNQILEVSPDGVLARPQPIDRPEISIRPDSTGLFLVPHPFYLKIWLMLNSHLYRMIDRYVLSAVSEGKTREDPESADVNPDERDYDIATQTIIADLETISEAAQSNEFDIAVVLLPRTGTVSAESCEDLSKMQTNLVFDEIESWANAQQIPALNTVPLWCKIDDPQGYFWPRDGHPTPEGYALIAQFVTDFLDQEGLVP